MIPANLIVVKYTQGGEYIRTDNYNDYTGPYYEFNGKTYTGDTYSLNSVEVIKKGSDQVNALLNNPATFTYGAISGQDAQQVNIVSIQFIATVEDINRGYATRYFVKKANETLIKETNQATYNQVKNNSLYQSLELKYNLNSVLSGLNENTELNEQQLPGITDYILAQETLISESGPRFEYYNNVQDNLPPSPPPFDPANDKGRKAEAPNISTVPDSYLMTVDGPFYGQLVPPGKEGKPEVVEKMAIFKGKDGKWSYVGLPVAKPLLLMIQFARQDGIELTVTNGFRPSLSPPDRISTTLKADQITDAQRKLYGIPPGSGITAKASSQEYLYGGYIARERGQKTYKGKYSEGEVPASSFNLAADPYNPRGGSSHSKSVAFDLNTGTKRPGNSAGSLDAKVYQWLIDYAWIFGFIRTVVIEEWHWEYRPGRYQFSTCNKEPNGYKDPWWDNMRLNPTVETEKRVAEIKAALASGNIPGITSSLPTTPTTSQYSAVLVGGRDDREGDKTLDEQVALLKKGIGEDKNVKGFRYTTQPVEIIRFLQQNPKVPVFMFSAGASKAYDLSLNKNIVDIQKFFIIEPYADPVKGKSTIDIVNKAIKVNKVPASNVFVDSTSSGRGAGIAPGVSFSDSKSPSQSYLDQHFYSLTTVGAKVKSLVPNTSTQTPEPQSLLIKPTEPKLPLLGISIRG